jgi:hypothetical protein
MYICLAFSIIKLTWLVEQISEKHWFLKKGYYISCYFVLTKLGNSNSITKVYVTTSIQKPDCKTY